MDLRCRHDLMLAAVAVISCGAACGPRPAPVAPAFERIVYELGDDGLEPPALVEEIHPQYTAEAMHARIVGSVELSAIVNRQGRVSKVMVTRSLDDDLGLDDEAVAAQQQWRFSPGTRLGEPVPVRVDVELVYNLR